MNMKFKVINFYKKLIMAGRQQFINIKINKNKLQQLKYLIWEKILIINKIIKLKFYYQKKILSLFDVPFIIKPIK